MWKDCKMKKLVIIISIVFSVHSLLAGNFELGNKAYNQKDYTQAIHYYQLCIQDGYQDAILYYNLGNAYFKNNNLGLSILWYERALKLDPGNEDIQHNLAFANNQTIDKIYQSEEFFLTRWWKGLLHAGSAKTWSIWSIVFCVFTCVFIAFILIAKRANWRVASFFLAISLGICMIFSIVFAIINKKEATSHNELIVTQLNVVIKSTPDISGTDLFSVHEGIKAKITDQTKGWYEVKFPNNEKGWIQAENVEVI